MSLRLKFIVAGFVLVVLTSLVGWYGYQLELETEQQSVFDSYQKNLEKTLHHYIQDKQNASLVMALVLSGISEFHPILMSPTPEHLANIRQDLRGVVLALKKDSRYQNIWIHFIDAKGVSRFRSWTQKTGDSVLQAREDVREMLLAPKQKTTFSVGKFTLSIKAMVPIYQNGVLIGMVEVIGQVNSIAKQLKKEQGVSSLVLVDKPYVAQLLYKNNTNLLQGYYVVNHSATPGVIDSFRNRDLNNLFMAGHYQVAKGLYLFAVPLFNKSKQLLGYWIFSVDEKKILTAQNKSVLLRYVLFVVLLNALFLFVLFVLFKQQVSKKEHAFYQTIFDLASTIILVSNGSKVISANKAFFKLFSEYPDLKSFNEKHECVCEFFSDEEGFIHPLMGGLDWHSYIISLPHIKHRVKIQRPEGDSIFQINVTHVESEEGFDVLIIVMEDITEQEKNKKALEFLTTHDDLTGLYNRYYFNQQLEQSVAMGERYQHPLSLIGLDIDHFKEINDVYGHDVGDAVLRLIAETLKKSVRSTDMVCRVGGEEISILMPETSLASAVSIAEKLRQTIEQLDFLGVGRSVTASFGVVELLPEDTAETLYKRADVALYTAKRNGRNQVFFDNDY